VANNIGIQAALAAGADYILLLNQDAYLNQDTVRILVRCAQANSQYGILSPLHLNGDGTAIDPMFVGYIAQGAPRYYSDLYLRQCKFVYDISFANAAAWLITRECLLTVGGFDPLFHMYFEDVDYCHRARFHRIGLVWSLPSPFFMIEAKLLMYLPVPGISAGVDFHVHPKGTSPD
jgi:GT2 family glycosyltransferase